MNLLLSLHAELLKTKRTAALYFTLIGAGLVPLIFLLNAFTDGLPDETQSLKDPMNAIFRINAEMNGYGIFPLYVILLCTLLSQVEHRNNTWKQVFTSPATKASLFLAKYMNTLLLILAFLVANHLFMWIVAVAIHFILPDINLLAHPLSATMVLVNATNSFITVLAICTFQFLVSLRFKNFLIPVAIGIALWFAGTLLAMEYKAQIVVYFPHSYALVAFSEKYNPMLSQVMWTSAGYSVLLLTLGFFDFRRKKISN